MLQVMTGASARWARWTSSPGDREAGVGARRRCSTAVQHPGDGQPDLPPRAGSSKNYAFAVQTSTGPANSRSRSPTSRSGVPRAERRASTLQAVRRGMTARPRQRRHSAVREPGAEPGSSPAVATPDSTSSAASVASAARWPHRRRRDAIAPSCAALRLATSPTARRSPSGAQRHGDAAPAHATKSAPRTLFRRRRQLWRRSEFPRRRPAPTASAIALGGRHVDRRVRVGMRAPSRRRDPRRLARRKLVEAGGRRPAWPRARLRRRRLTAIGDGRWRSVGIIGLSKTLASLCAGRAPRPGCRRYTLATGAVVPHAVWLSRFSVRGAAPSRRGGSTLPPAREPGRERRSTTRATIASVSAARAAPSRRVAVGLSHTHAGWRRQCHEPGPRS